MKKSNEMNEAAFFGRVAIRGKRYIDFVDALGSTEVPQVLSALRSIHNGWILPDPEAVGWYGLSGNCGEREPATEKRIAHPKKRASHSMHLIQIS
jgi:hypothetical protein